VITRVARVSDGRGRADETNSFLLRGAGEEDKAFEDEPIEILIAEPAAAMT
jgi:hypothetical protein